MDTNKEKSTNEIRMITLDVVRSQAEVCAERRGRVADRASAVSVATNANTQAIAAVAESVAALTVIVTQFVATQSAQMATMATTVADQATVDTKQQEQLGRHETKLAVIAVKVGGAALLGGSLLPVAQWIYQLWNH